MVDEENLKQVRPAWERMGEGLVAGVHHALNNRMASLRAVGQVLEADLPPSHPLAGALTGELDRLEKTTKLLALLGVSEQQQLPIPIGDVLNEARSLYEIHHSLRDITLRIEVAQNLLPVMVNPSALLRGVMLAIAHVAPTRGDVEIFAAGDEKVVRIVVEGRAADSEMSGPAIPSVTIEEVRAEVETAGATIQAVGDDSVALDVLTLTEARRREAEQN